MTSKEVLKKVDDHMKSSVDHLKQGLKTIRAGRANPAILDRISVDYYGTMTPLNQMSTISTPEARLITIQPYDQSVIESIEKAILQSDLGLNPSNDGKIIRLSIPMLTEEKRKEISKDVKTYGEDAKIAIRNIRRDANEELKTLEKNSDITEDDLERDEKKVQEKTDQYTELVDQMIKEKIAEIMEV